MTYLTTFLENPSASSSFELVVKIHCYQIVGDTVEGEAGPQGEGDKRGVRIFLLPGRLSKNSWPELGLVWIPLGNQPVLLLVIVKAHLPKGNEASYKTASSESQQQGWLDADNVCWEKGDADHTVRTVATCDHCSEPHVTFPSEEERTSSPTHKCITLLQRSLVERAEMKMKNMD